MATWFRATHASPLLDLLLPERCVSCGAGETVVCEWCAAELRFLRAPLCARCGAPTAWPVARCVECAGRRVAFATARAAVAYEGVASTLVVAWKERGLRSLAGFFADVVTAEVPKPTARCIAFVPGDRDRSLWRGQNSAEVL